MSTRISADAFKAAGGRTITVAPGGQYGLMPVDEGVQILRYVGEREFEPMETVADEAAAQARMSEISADAYSDYMEEAEATAEAHRPLLDRYGFSLWHTGGGCLAYGRMHGDVELLVTLADGASVDGDASATVWSCGTSHEDGSFDSAGSFTLEEALQNATILAERLPRATNEHYEPDAFRRLIEIPPSKGRSR